MKPFYDIEAFISTQIIGKGLWLLGNYCGSKNYFQVVRIEDNSYICRHFSCEWLDKIFSGEDEWDENEVEAVAANVYDFTKSWLKFEDPIDIVTDEEVFGDWLDVFYEYVHMYRR